MYVCMYHTHAHTHVHIHVRTHARVHTHTLYKVMVISISSASGHTTTPLLRLSGEAFHKRL